MRPFVSVSLAVCVVFMLACMGTRNKSDNSSSSNQSSSSDSTAGRPNPDKSNRDRPTSDKQNPGLDKQNPNTDKQNPPPANSGPMQGVWVPVEGEVGGMKLIDQQLRSIKWTVNGNQVTYKDWRQTGQGTISINPNGNPKTFDLVSGPITFLGIYEESGDTLKVCYDIKKARPTAYHTNSGQGGGAVFYVMKRAQSDRPGGPGDPQPMPGDALELAKFKGTWKPTEGEFNGAKMSDAVLRAVTFTLDGNQISFPAGQQNARGTFSVNANASPKTFDITGGATLYGIYEFSGDTLKICTGTKGRPAGFSTQGTPNGEFRVMYVLKRAPN
jgi:uncharacterized protein (TIGR03067 family)